jgi:hypothetical protein
MHRFLSVAALFAALALTSCASIVSDSTYPVTITSSPENLPIKIENEKGQVLHTGQTPMTVTLKAGDGWFSGATYYAVGPKGGKVMIDSGVDGWYWGNLLFGGVIGFLIVDPNTGAMYDLPELVYLNQQPIDISDVDPEKLRQ